MGIPKGYVEVADESIPAGYAEVPSGPVAPEPAPISPVEGASPWEAGQVPAASETRPMVRPMAQGAVGGLVGLATGSPIAAGAAGALTGAGVDVLYGKKPDPNEVGWDAALGIGLPLGGTAYKSTIGPAIQKTAGKAAMGLYESAAKILPSITSEERSKRVLTALRDRILPVGQKSIDQLDSFTKEMDDIVGVALTKRTVAGDMIATGDIKKAARAKLAQMESGSIFGEDTVKSLKSELSAIDALPDYITPSKALTYRKDLNRRLTGYFERSKKSGLTTVENAENTFIADTRKNLNNSIYDLIPELRELGKRESEIIGLKQTVERATNQIGNKDILSIGSLVVGGLAEGAARLDEPHSSTYRAATAGAAGMLAYSILSRPNVKAQIAFQLAKIGKLTTASPTTLELIGMTKESAMAWAPRLKALNAAPAGQLPWRTVDESFVKGVPAKYPVAANMGETIPGNAGPSRDALLYDQGMDTANRIQRGYLGDAVPNAPPARTPFEEWIMQRDPSVKKLLTKQGMEVYDRIKAGHLGDVVTPLGPKAYLGEPFDTLGRGLTYKGKALK
jgi:hypothetical protein